SDAPRQCTRCNLGHLPTRQIGVHAVLKSRVDQLVRERLKEIAVFRMRTRAFNIQVASEYETGIGGKRERSPTELSGLHVVLQYGDCRILVLERGMSDFVKHHDLSSPDDADCLRV